MNKTTSEKATTAMCNLFVFDAIIGALENGTIVGDIASSDANRIIKIAKKAQIKQLKIHDRHMARLK